MQKHIIDTIRDIIVLFNHFDTATPFKDPHKLPFQYEFCLFLYIDFITYL